MDLNVASTLISERDSLEDLLNMKMRGQATLGFGLCSGQKDIELNVSGFSFRTQLSLYNNKIYYVV